MEMNEHSLWLSAVPVEVSPDKTSYTIPPDTKFMYLGSGGLSISNTYNGNTVGVYGKGYDSAYFVDSASGSVTNISLSTRRTQPLNPDDSESNGDANYNIISNAKLIRCLRAIKQSRQLLHGAYILRIYNHTQKPNTRNIPYDIPVYISNYNARWDMESPIDLYISLQLIKRSPVNGINLGNTVYSSEVSQ